MTLAYCASKQKAGRIKLEIDGVLIGDTLSSDKKKRLIELVTLLRPWLESGQPQSAASQPAAPIQSPPVADPAQAVYHAPVPSSTQPLPPLTRSLNQKKTSQH